MAKPEKKFKCGAVEAAVFANEIEKNGTKIQLKMVSIQMGISILLIQQYFWNVSFPIIIVKKRMPPSMRFTMWWL